MISLGMVLDEQRFTAVLLDTETGATETARGALSDLATLSEWQRRAGARSAALLDGPLYTRQLTFPFTQPRKIRQVLPLQLDDHLPGPADAFEQHVLIGERDGQGVADVLLVPASSVVCIRDALLEAGVLPRTLEPLGLALTGICEGICTVLVGLQRTIVACRSAADDQPFVTTIPFGQAQLDVDDVRNNLVARIMAALPGERREVRLVGSSAVMTALVPALESRGVAIQSVTEDDVDEWLATVAARELALRRRPATWNLAPRRPLIPPEIVESGILQQVAAPVAALLVMIAAVVVTGNRALLAEAGAARAEIREIFHRNFPDSRIVDPLRQMQAVVDRAGTGEAAAERMPVLQSLLTFHRALPQDLNVQVDELRSGDGIWLLRGLADDYGTVDRIKAAAESIEAFRNVRVQRAEQTLDKAHVRFTLSWEEAG